MRGVLMGIGLALVGVALYLAMNIIQASGRFAKLEQKLVDSCSRLDVFPGTEDVTIDPDSGLAFVSGADRRAAFAGNPVPGGIYAFNVATHDSVWKVSPEALTDFQPHGISLWRGANGEKRLFVINHASGGAQKVEIFDVGDQGMLTHVESVAFNAMHSPNDVLGVGPRQFYATNDRGYDSGLLGTMEAYLSLPFASAVYYDGAEGRIVKKGLVYANGVNMSADGKTVYISEFLKRRIGFYDRNVETGALTKVKAIRVNTFPDNIEVAKDGALWIGGHSKVFAFLKHARDPKAVAPSHVIRLNPRNGVKSDVLIDTTGKISGSSVGAVWDKTLIVGAVFDGHVMVCPLLEIFLNNAGTNGGN